MPPDPDPGTWRRHGRLSLRARLLTAALLLVGAGLAVADTAGLAVLHASLVARVDRQLVPVAQRVAQRLDRGGAVAGLPGPPGLPGVQRPGGPALPSAYALVLLGPGGGVQAELASALTPVGSLPRLPRLPGARVAALAGRPFDVSSADGRHPWRVVVEPLASGQGSLAVAASLTEVAATLGRLRLIDLVVSVAVLVALTAVGAGLVRAALRPLREIEATAGAIAAGELSRRVPEHHPGTEVGRLSAALNGMLAQIESAFAARTRSEERMRRFVADASHELRTPLTSVRGFAELYRQACRTTPGGPPPQDTARWMARIEQESARMAGLVEDLLLLARLDAQRPLATAPVDLAVLAADAVNDAAALTPDHPVRLLAPPGPVWVPGDEARLRQVLANLVGNALTHTPAGTQVTVGVARAGRPEAPEAVLEVVDTGPGLPPGLPVFERFVRADDSRGRTGAPGGPGQGGPGGSGLGLSIVAAIVAAHAGAVRARSRPGGGCSVQVRLPALPAPPAPPAARAGR